MNKLYTIGSAVFIACAAAAYGSGLTEIDLVNTQQLDMNNVSSVTIAYHSDNLKLLRGDSDSLVIKEYMSIDDSDYYAQVSYAAEANAEKRLLIEAGKRPIGGFQGRAEVYVPASFTGAVAVETSSGSISADDALGFSAISLESTSGSITIYHIKADTTAFVKTTSGSIRVKRMAAQEIRLSASSGSIRGEEADGITYISTASGGIDFERVNGHLAAGSSSGSINVKMVTGALKARTASGSQSFSVAESAGNIDLSATSGSVTLGLPKDLRFRFSAKMSSGSLSTPFSDRLYSPFSDKHSATGTINAKDIAEDQLISIDITTASGSIQVRWM